LRSFIIFASPWISTIFGGLIEVIRSDDCR
jgi:hypothetical protein